MSKRKIGVIVGSLRKGSFSRSIADCVIKVAPENLQMEIIEIGQLPIYNQDFDSESMPVLDEFRAKIKSLDGVLFITPEHNRSIPVLLKNALDVASRPWGQNAWSGKPGAIISHSPSGIGGFGANHHLRQVLTFLNVMMLQQPESYIPNVNSYLDDKGVVVVEGTINILRKFMDAYGEWVNRVIK